MNLFVNEKTIETDNKIYEFGDSTQAEKFTMCLASMDEMTSCQWVMPVKVTSKGALPARSF